MLALSAVQELGQQEEQQVPSPQGSLRQQVQEQQAVSWLQPVLQQVLELELLVASGLPEQPQPQVQEFVPQLQWALVFQLGPLGLQPPLARQLRAQALALQR
jgi:hypothetical protein